MSLAGELAAPGEASALALGLGALAPECGPAASASAVILPASPNWHSSSAVAVHPRLPLVLLACKDAVVLVAPATGGGCPSGPSPADFRVVAWHNMNGSAGAPNRSIVRVTAVAFAQSAAGAAGPGALLEDALPAVRLVAGLSDNRVALFQVARGAAGGPHGGARWVLRQVARHAGHRSAGSTADGDSGGVSSEGTAAVPAGGPGGRARGNRSAGTVPPSSVTTVSASADSPWVVSGDGLGRVVVWRLPSGDASAGPDPVAGLLDSLVQPAGPASDPAARRLLEQSRFPAQTHGGSEQTGYWSRLQLIGAATGPASAGASSGSTVRGGGSGARGRGPRAAVGGSSGGVAAICSDWAPFAVPVFAIGHQNGQISLCTVLPGALLDGSAPFAVAISARLRDHSDAVQTVRFSPFPVSPFAPGPGASPERRAVPTAGASLGPGVDSCPTTPGVGGPAGTAASVGPLQLASCAGLAPVHASLGVPLVETLFLASGSRDQTVRVWAVQPGLLSGIRAPLPAGDSHLLALATSCLVRFNYPRDSTGPGGGRGPGAAGGPSAGDSAPDDGRQASRLRATLTWSARPGAPGRAYQCVCALSTGAAPCAGDRLAPILLCGSASGELSVWDLGMPLVRLPGPAGGEAAADEALFDMPRYTTAGECAAWRRRWPADLLAAPVLQHAPCSFRPASAGSPDAPAPLGARLIRRLTTGGHNRTIFGLDFGGFPSPGVGASISMDRQVIIWSLADLQPVTRMPTLGAFGWALSVAPETGPAPRQVALAVGDGTVRLFDPCTVGQRRLLPSSGPTPGVGAYDGWRSVWRRLNTQVTACRHAPASADPHLAGRLAYGLVDGGVGLLSAGSASPAVVPSPGFHQASVQAVVWLRVTEPDEAPGGGAAGGAAPGRWSLASLAADGQALLLHRLAGPPSGAERPAGPEPADARPAKKRRKRGPPGDAAESGPGAPSSDAWASGGPFMSGPGPGPGPADLTGAVHGGQAGLPADARPTALAGSPCGRVLAVGFSSGHVCLYVLSGALEHRLLAAGATGTAAHPPAEACLVLTGHGSVPGQESITSVDLLEHDGGLLLAAATERGRLHVAEAVSGPAAGGPDCPAAELSFGGFESQQHSDAGVAVCWAAGPPEAVRHPGYLGSLAGAPGVPGPEATVARLLSLAQNGSLQLWHVVLGPERGRRRPVLAARYLPVHLGQVHGAAAMLLPGSRGLVILSTGSDQTLRSTLLADDLDPKLLSGPPAVSPPGDGPVPVAAAVAAPAAPAVPAPAEAFPSPGPGGPSPAKRPRGEAPGRAAVSLAPDATPAASPATGSDMAAGGEPGLAPGRGLFWDLLGQGPGPAPGQACPFMRPLLPMAQCLAPGAGLLGLRHPAGPACGRQCGLLPLLLASPTRDLLAQLQASALAMPAGRGLLAGVCLQAWLGHGRRALERALVDVEATCACARCRHALLAGLAALAGHFAPGDLSRRYAAALCRPAGAGRRAAACAADPGLGPLLGATLVLGAEGSAAGVRALAEAGLWGLAVALGRVNLPAAGSLDASAAGPRGLLLQEVLHAGALSAASPAHPAGPCAGPLLSRFSRLDGPLRTGTSAPAALESVFGPPESGGLVPTADVSPVEGLFLRLDACLFLLGDETLPLSETHGGATIPVSERRNTFARLAGAAAEVAARLGARAMHPLGAYGTGGDPPGDGALAGRLLYRAGLLLQPDGAIVAEAPAEGGLAEWVTRICELLSRQEST
ncbi:hypothetical protein H696_03562 [Fonticula alba]|uniref:Uncharacterized protein n=1 Tax=Fonticula alba TaxID=691883 RepID=A0A058Z767_FONAL|nr:hypothetical protein H696_03562 [Fonticula alba]KCV70100.1 hypothetical protein H696_03562 [Fonticula alba]|eukprot:XP_009495706.1 hypothetical protein H696_03562 [Fonticula alba]